ncbi:glycosyltransferase family 2 protein [Novosphingobium lentum]|uniref:glycosyltransferase family 2 protein n=1 Tax=Novosphingobium lentum TaxID=145287 RepID=UPI000834D581|nr:glycosyltransferase [Novosphingobium lentum]
MTHDTGFALDQHGRLADKPALATVLFTAHNRKDMVLRAIELALQQTIPVHIIVADDASTDGTQDAVKAAFPGVTYLRTEQSRGPCHQRNNGLAVATTDIVFPLDDDSMLVSPQTLAQAMGAFAAADVAIVAMPFQNILQETRVLQAPDWGKGVQFFDFVACAHGLRRAPVVEAGGFFEGYFYMGEETDLALRMQDRGWRTVIVDSDPIHHMQPPARRSYRPDFYGRRNDILFTWLRAPMPGLPWELARALVRGLLFGARTGRLKAAFHGYRAAVREIFSGRYARQPVKREVYRALMASRRRRRAIPAEYG